MSTRLLKILTAAFLGILSAGCDMFTMADPVPVHNKNSVLPPEFLYTKYKPLNDWLDTPVRVQIFDTKLMDVFRHPTLDRLNFRIVSRPKLNPVVNIDQLGMTRRQLLWSICHDYQLSMTPMFGDHGETSYIDVRAN